jgi:hypothetical protein
MKLRRAAADAFGVVIGWPAAVFPAYSYDVELRLIKI